MRLATVRRADGSTRAARVDGDTLTLLDESDVGALLATGEGWQARAAAASGATVALADTTLATLVPNPPKVWCVGLNYANHIGETGSKTPEYPTLFAKFAISLTGPNDPIAVRPTSDRVDWEVELGVVIGSSGVTSHGPTGVARSHDLPWRNCAVRRCQSRIDTSLTTV